MKVLIIDDEENIRLLLHDILKRKGYETIGVSSAEEGLKVVKKKESLCLILLDLKLGGKMQGEDFLKKLQELKIWKKVLIITANPKEIEKELKERFPKLVRGSLMKPFEIQKLLKNVKKYCK